MFRSKRRAGSPSRSISDEDPFTKLLQPPPNETEQERTVRLHNALEAQRVSKEIDEEILEAKKLFEKKKRAIKILLLGQSEAGKSSVLRNFQLAYTPKQLQSEKAAWRTIIQLNLIVSIRKVLEAIQNEWDPYFNSNRASASTPLADKHRRIRMGLSPLLSIENTLTQTVSPVQNDSALVNELRVRAGSNWKLLLDMTTPSGSGENPRVRASYGSARNDPTKVLAACRQDIIALWEDPAVQAVLRRQDVMLELMPGFFLNDTARIATNDYEPTDSDIVRARIRTVGVEEWHLEMEKEGDAGAEYIIYDVGGSRSSRFSWIPFFEDVQAILFLAPLAFNQVLEEDPKVNRIQDSIAIWRDICGSPLLAKAFIILFFNKMDILQANLDAGIKVRHYVPSYGDGPNDVMSVTKYFRDKFKAYHKRLSPHPRPFICYETSAIDTRATAALLDGVQSAILQRHLERINVL